MFRPTRFALAIAAALLATGVHAKTLRTADQGDAVSMDPHSLNETTQLGFTGNVYEPLVTRDAQLKLAPSLATSWKQTAPTVWRFELRKGVTFHDGSPFTADDVLFSFARGADPGSDMRGVVGPIKEVKKVDDHTVEIVTTTPQPILPDSLTSFYMMSKAWCEANGAARPVDKRKGLENAASVRANGTGPFRLRSREPGVRTVLVRNTQYWGKVEGNVTEVIWTPIGNDATRVAALKSGEIQLMQPVPVQDVERLKTDPNIKVMQGPELRTIFLGMDSRRDELLYSSVKGRNPFKDKRVRQAFYQAIDIEAIRTRIMRGAATPLNLMVAPGVNGFNPDLNKRPPYDPEASKKLLADAGYPNGFEIRMNCPNDRYVNDGEICQAVAGMLARVGVKVNLEAETKNTYFPKILSRNTSFYLLGWTPTTYDAHNTLYNIMATPQGGQGVFNLGSWSNARFDELTTAIGTETDQAKRNAMIAEAMKIHAEDFGHIPLHAQALAWAARKNVNIVQRADNIILYRTATVD
ncbi:MAG: ABC transporter substrate-binding protein [Burkholderiales bacterium]|jgi:peptide/nickel transport system substrate-binding protein